MSSTDAAPVDDLKTLINKEYKRKLRHLKRRHAERPWAHKNHLRYFPCDQCVALGRQCELFMTKARCKHCKDMECSRQHQDMFERVQLERLGKDFSRVDFDRLLEEVQKEHSDAVLPAESNEVSGSTAAANGGTDHRDSSVVDDLESLFELKAESRGNSPSNGLGQQEDLLRQIREENIVNMTLHVTLADRDSEIQDLKRKLELEREAYDGKEIQLRKEINKAQSQLKHSENWVRVLREELKRIKDHATQQSKPAEEAPPVSEENHRSSVQQASHIKQVEDLTRENDRLTRKNEELAERLLDKTQQWREEKRKIVESAEHKDERSQVKLAGLRETLAKHDQEQNSRAVLVYTTLTSLSMKLGECLSTPGSPNLKQRSSIVYRNMKELLEETSKWLPLKPSQLISLLRSGVKADDEDMEDVDISGNDEEDDHSDDDQNEQQAHRAAPHTPDSSLPRPLRKRPRVE